MEEVRPGVSLHAEMHCLRQLRNLKNTKGRKSPRNKKTKLILYSFRFSKTGKLGMAKPCKDCMRQLEETLPRLGYRIDWVYYSTADSKIIKIRFRDLLQDKSTTRSRGWAKFHGEAV